MNDLRTGSGATSSSEVARKPPRTRPDQTKVSGKHIPRRQSIDERARRRQITSDDDELESDDNLVDSFAAKRSARLSAERREKAAVDDAAPSTRPERRKSKTAEADLLDEVDSEDRDELFPWHYQFDEDEEPEELQASTPLLSRAFRASG